MEFPRTDWALAILFFAGAFLASLTLTPLCRGLGHVLGMVDQPGGRRQHAQPTPRTGGIAVFVAFQVATALLLLFHSGDVAPDLIQAWRYGFLPASIPLFLMGLWDDRHELSAGLKLGGQVLVALIAWAGGIQLDSLLALPLPVWIDLPLTVLLVLASVNAMNLIDGMDGVAAGLAVTSALGLAGLFALLGQVFPATLALALAGASLGFLRYNFHPASVFLGDAGSTFLGLALISLMLNSNARGAALVILGLPFLVLGVPFIDTLLAIWRRSMRRFSQGKGHVFGGDRDHLHHRLARRGLNQRRVAWILYAVNAFLVLGGVAIMALDSYRLTIFIVLFCALAYVVLRHFADLELMDSGRMIVDGIRRPGRRRLIRLSAPLIDLAALGAAAWALHHLSPSLNGMVHREWFLTRMAPALVVTPFVFMAFAGVYRRVWRRARITEFVGLGLSVLVGVGLAAGVLQGMMEIEPLTLALLVFAYLGMVMPCVIGIRLFPRVVQDLYHLFATRGAAGENLSPVLIYGAGYGYTLFSRAESFAASHHQLRHRVVGLIDDDPSLVGWRVHGHRVLGTSRDLDRLLDMQRVKGIVVTTYLRETNHARLMRIVADHGLDLYVWRAETLEDPSSEGALIPVLAKPGKRGAAGETHTGTQLNAKNDSLRAVPQ